MIILKRKSEEQGGDGEGLNKERKTKDDEYDDENAKKIKYTNTLLMVRGNEINEYTITGQKQRK